MPSKIRQFGDLAKQFNQIVDAIAIDSGQIQTITQEGGLDSAAIIALIDSDYLATRQSFDFNDVTGKPTTLSGYGIANAKTSAQQDSDITATIDTVRDGVATELNNLNKMAAAINDDADFFNAVKSYTFENAPKATAQGVNNGYTTGGRASPGLLTYYDIIDKFPFASDANATDVGDLSTEFHASTGQSSTTHGYVAGGEADLNNIEKFSFSSNGNSTDVGDLLSVLTRATGHEGSSHGYVSGGNTNASPFADSVRIDIQKFSFSVDGNSTSVGQLTEKKIESMGSSSSHCGYVAGGKGYPASTYTNKIERFPFAVDTYSTDIGDLTTSRKQGAGNSSDTHGYVSGGQTPQVSPATDIAINTIEKYPFASAISMTAVGDLTGISNITGAASQNSNVSGYVTNGQSSPSYNDVQKFSFTSDADATAVGDLTVSRNFLGGGAGQQN